MPIDRTVPEHFVCARWDPATASCASGWAQASCGGAAECHPRRTASRTATVGCGQKLDATTRATPACRWAEHGAAGLPMAVRTRAPTADQGMDARPHVPHQGESARGVPGVARPASIGVAASSSTSRPCLAPRRGSVSNPAADHRQRCAASLPLGAECMRCECLLRLVGVRTYGRGAARKQRPRKNVSGV